MGTISIEATPVTHPYFEWSPVTGSGHLLIVYKNDLGDEFVIRGGPRINSSGGFGEIILEIDKPINESIDRRINETAYDRGNTVLDLNGQDAHNVWEIMKQYAASIHQQNIQYDIFGFNSNSVVANLLRIVNIDINEFLPNPNGLTLLSYMGKNLEFEFDYSLHGTSGNDVLSAGKGEQHFYGQSGNDKFHANLSGDFFDGGLGLDIISYENSSVGIIAYDSQTSPRSILIESAGAIANDSAVNIEFIVGSRFNDEFDTHNLKIIHGMSGNDIFNVNKYSDQYNQFYDGGENIDSIIFSNFTKSVDLNFKEISSASDLNGNGNISFINVEIIVGSAFDDIFTFNDFADFTEIRFLHGGDGIDTIFMANFVSLQDSEYQTVSLEEGRYGNSTNLSGIENVTGGNGHDIIIGSSEANVLIAKGNADYIDGRGGQDTIIGAEHNDTLIGGDDNDLFDGKGGHDIINAGAGNDTIYGGAYADTITGGAGNDIIYGGYAEDHFADHGDSILGGLGSDTIYGGRGDDWLFGDEEDDFIFGELGDDKIFGGTGDDWLDGGQGRDSIDGGDGDDFIFGGAGYDTLEGGIGNDLLDGGSGDDTLRGGAGQDTIQGGSGYNVLYGGADADLFTCGQGYDRIMDFEFGLDKISRDGMNGALYEVRSFVGDLIITANGHTIVIEAQNIGSMFHEWRSGYGYYGNDIPAFQAQFDLLWA